MGALPSPSRTRVKTPTLLQMEAVECGAAALGITLGYYGRFVQLEELRTACGVSRDGSKLSRIKYAAKSYGMDARGFAHKAETVRDEGEFPCIIFWRGNHYVVLEGFKGDSAYINDPASGPAKYSWKEFQEAYSGKLLKVSPLDEFEPGGTSPSTLKSLVQRTHGYKNAIQYFLIAALFLVIPGLAIPAFTQIFIDEVLVSGRKEWVPPLLLAMGLTVLITGFLTWLHEFYLLRYQSSLALSDSSRFFFHVLRLPITFFAQRFGGEVGRRVQLNDNIAQMVAEKLSHMIVDLIKMFFFGLLMCFYSVPLAVATLLLGGVNFIVIRTLARRRVDNSRCLQKDEGKLIGTAMGGLQMMETIKGTGGEDEFFQRWAGYQAKTLTAKQTLGFISRSTEALPTFINGCSTVVILCLGGLEVMGGNLTVGMLVAFQTVAKQFTNPFASIVSVSGQMQELQGEMARVDDVMAHPRDPVYNDHPRRNIVKIKLSGRVDLVDITFGYGPRTAENDREKPLLENFNLTIKPGQRVALVGGSGSGKSTVARLISGLIQPWSGSICFDGVPREEVPPDLLNSSIAVVDQDVFLFEGTVRDNLTMWDATIPDTSVMSALKDASILDLISARPGGVRSMVEEGGRNFSGGQRQRLEIARALAGQPTFLMLDEATSALDPPTEKEIEKSLMRRGCSCLIVAHRLTTVRDCDEIVVMSEGKVIERGSHEELVALEGAYFKLIQE